MERRTRIERVLAEAIAEQLASAEGTILNKELSIVAIRLEDVPRETLIQIGDKLLRKKRDRIFLGFSALNDEKKTLVVVLSPDQAISKGYRANRILKRVLELLGGSGGGSDRIAIGGSPKIIRGEDVDRLIDSIRSTPT